MKIVLTGGNGLVGRTLRTHPNSRQFEIFSPSRQELDLSDANCVDEYLKRIAPDAVIHAAGTVGGIQANVSAPVKFMTENLLIGINVMRGARNAGIKTLLNLGSSCMYPRDAPNPLHEDLILTGELEPTNEGYALAKIACARLAQYMAAEDPELGYKTIIPCNLYGPYDNFDPVKSHMIPAAMRKIHDAIQNGSKTVEIWGDGHSRREFMFSSDLADAIIYALSHFDAVPQNMNVGLGYDYTINEYYQVIAEEMGFDGEFRHDLSKPTGMKQKLLNVNAAKTLGWVAKTDLRDGIRKTLTYFRSEVIK